MEYEIGDIVRYEAHGFKRGPFKLVEKIDHIKNAFISESGEVHLMNAVGYFKVKQNE